MAVPFAKYPPFPLFNVEINQNHYGFAQNWAEGVERRK